MSLLSNVNLLSVCFLITCKTFTDIIILTINGKYYLLIPPFCRLIDKETSWHLTLNSNG